jgi:hypothetical protein
LPNSFIAFIKPKFFNGFKIVRLTSQMSKFLEVLKLIKFWDKVAPLQSFASNVLPKQVNKWMGDGVQFLLIN